MVCKICGIDFIGNRKFRKYCHSKKCVREVWRINANRRRKELGQKYKDGRKEYDDNRYKKLGGTNLGNILECEICENEFTRSGSKQTCCSTLCLKKKQSQKALKRYYNNYEKNKIKRKKDYKRRKKEDPNYYIMLMLRSRLRDALNAKNVDKTISAITLIGCSISNLKKHLEQKFTEKMSWDNYGFKGWHIDHIKPCASFNLSNEEEQKKCFNYNNLQPLWWRDNFAKGASYDEVTNETCKD